MVGCVLAATDGSVIADGYHRRCGGPHAEVDAIAAAGPRAQGAIALVTLEPCNHRGRTGPCSEALADAGVAEVVYAVADPNPLAKGGAVRLAERGIPAFHVPHAGAAELALPFLKRVRTGLPWISAKWAQSIDGAIALANGDSRWLSGERSRRMVHRERGRVDAILTGIGTVLEDDPRLNARGVRVHRAARRIVFDPDARTPIDALVVAQDPALTTVLVRREPDGDAGFSRRVDALSARGVRVLPLGNGDLIEPALRALAADGVATVLVEAGGGLVGRLAREHLLDEAWVFVAPLLVADDVARRSARGLAPEVLAAIPRARLLSVRRRGEDALLHYRWTAPDRGA
jgi:diaminohydroxyphosphoribosylaminopyrimidine deaminase/5-amino-6-(5-phosphoribosylamino)uracil reductase